MIMLMRNELFPLNFYKKEKFNGSMRKMNYRLQKVEDHFVATVWKGPYCYDATDKEEMTTSEFPFSEEGINAAVEWFNSKQKEFNE